MLLGRVRLAQLLVVVNGFLLDQYNIYRAIYPSATHSTRICSTVAPSHPATLMYLNIHVFASRPAFPASTFHFPPAPPCFPRGFFCTSSRYFHCPGIETKTNPHSHIILMKIIVAVPHNDRHKCTNWAGRLNIPPG
ncbi:hypothetical protein QBC38DRAFT_479183 [Podospora fimiseda]|uniref:Secreted protein n=1 Tax=Podospora fimiseda TaxID=252190 RepID=A0AAN7BP88_9PEZI|nr:hypothetical protein QBC38DRAFT_479183 [Podospora fimiseda]